MSQDTPETVILVALVDDNRISREEHTRLLNAEPGVTVISAEATLSVTMLANEHPDVVLVEAGETDVVALRAVTTRRVLPDAGVVITDMVPENEGLAHFVKAGVAGFVLKEATIGELADAVRSVADGSHVLPDDLTSPLFVQIASEGIEIDAVADGKHVRAHVAIHLTLREQEVVALVRKGLGNKQIAARLLISIHTVKSHVRSAMKKKGIRTRVLLALSSAPPTRDSPLY